MTKNNKNPYYQKIIILNRQKMRVYARIHTIINIIIVNSGRVDCNVGIFTNLVFAGHLLLDAGVYDAVCSCVRRRFYAAGLRLRVSSSVLYYFIFFFWTRVEAVAKIQSSGSLRHKDNNNKNNTNTFPTPESIILSRKIVINHNDSVVKYSFE